MATFTPSCGGPRCGSISFGTLHPPRGSKRWRWRSTRPRVVTRAYVEGLGLLYMMDQAVGVPSDGERAFVSIVVHGAGRRTSFSQALMSSDLSFFPLQWNQCLRPLLTLVLFFSGFREEWFLHQSTQLAAWLVGITSPTLSLANLSVTFTDTRLTPPNPEHPHFLGTTASYMPQSSLDFSSTT